VCTFWKATEHFFIHNHLVHVPSPPFSPDLALSDFWIFGHIKNSLVGQTFDGPEDLLEDIIAFLGEIQASELQIVFGHWVSRVKWVLQHNGNYYHGQNYPKQKDFLVCFAEGWRHS
jgi:hypothetical protein